MDFQTPKSIDSSTGILAAIAITVITGWLLVPFSKRRQTEQDGSMEADKNSYLNFVSYEPKATWSSDFRVLHAMWFSKITGNDLQERLNCFYEHQADLYDSYRIRMLHGRPRMLQAVARHLKAPPPTEAATVWVDLACGTGYNVENFRDSLDKFSSIYLLDLCVPLCQVAQRERADKYSNKNTKFTVIHGDATDFDCPGLPVVGSVDLVTITYSLVMIPDWNKAIQNAKRLLKPGTGMLAVCDFTLAPDQTTLARQFWKRTFEQDHVFLDEAHLETLQKEFDVVDTAQGYGTLPYTPPFLQAPYYYFIGTKKKA